MRLARALLSYVDYKRGLGMKFHTEPRILAAYGRAAGEIDIAEVTSALAQRFLMPTARQTRASEIKYWALRGFYKFSIARQYVSRSALPTRMTTQPQVLVPIHLFTRRTVQLLKLASTVYMRAPRVEPAVIHALIALMYGAGLRISEAVGLTLVDVDVRQQQI